MKEEFKKILQRLEREIAGKPTPDEYNNGINRAYSIVKEVAEEYKGGWIPCSKRLPEIDENTSDIVLVCGSNGFQYMAFWCDDLKWRFCECGMAKNTILWTEIVAWQPLPEPFRDSD